jgi:phage repressor protein C with HTH and peptisase S24 domain
MEWAEKIRCIEEELGISKERGRLAHLLGVRPGRISEIKNGKSKNPGADIPLLLISTLGVNPEWLNKEKLPIFTDSNWLKKQPFTLENIRRRAEKTASSTLPDTPTGGTMETQRQNPPGVPLIYEGDSELNDGIVIPLLENAASAGYGAGLDEDDVPLRYVQVPRHLAKYPHLASLPVKGDSMEPTMHDGDLVVCDGGGWDGDGIYVLKTYETAYVKRVQLSTDGYKVVSDNKMYDSFTESVEKLSIVGKVRAILVIVPGRRGGV